MSTVSPQLVLGLCIVGACVATVVGYSLSHLLRQKVLNEHEESDEMTNPFHEMSREQKEYMSEVRKRTADALGESLRIELQKDQERQCATMGIRDGGRGGSYFVGSRYDYTRAVYNETHPSDSGSGSGTCSAAQDENGYVNVGGYYDHLDPVPEQSSGSAFLEVPPQHRISAKDSRGSGLIDDWERQNGAFSRTFEGIAAGGMKPGQYRWTR